jgi:hypothetical protein
MEFTAGTGRTAARDQRPGLLADDHGRTLAGLSYVGWDVRIVRVAADVSRAKVAEVQRLGLLPESHSPRRSFMVKSA